MMMIMIMIMVMMMMTLKRCNNARAEEGYTVTKYEDDNGGDVVDDDDYNFKGATVPMQMKATLWRRSKSVQEAGGTRC